MVYRCLGIALDTGHLMAAGNMLLELSRIRDEMGSIESAARAIAIASVIPSKPWPTMAEEVAQRRRLFEANGHAEELAAADASIGKADWQLLARAEVPQPPHPGAVKQR